MNIKGIAVIILTGISSGAFAQSLDIGGVELRIGQSTNEAISLLSAYKVQFKGSGWFVTNKSTEDLIGYFKASGNRLVYLEKGFKVNNNSSEVYYLARSELISRGGLECVSSESETSNGSDKLIQFIKKCGPYEFRYLMPITRKYDSIISISTPSTF